MAELLFKCAWCGKHMAIDTLASGSPIKCTSCEQPTLVPAGTIAVKCSSCGTSFYAAQEMAGESPECPECNALLQIVAETAESLSRVPFQRQEPQYEELKRYCQNCEAEVEWSAILCLACGIDLRTGKPFVTKSRRQFDLRAFATYLLILLLAGAAFLIWQHRIRLAEMEQQRISNELLLEQEKQQHKREMEKMVAAEEEWRLAEHERQQRQAAAAARGEQVARQIETLRNYHLNSGEIALPDALAFLMVRNQGLNFAIDPLNTKAMAELKVEVAELKQLAERDFREQWLARHGFIVKESQLRNSPLKIELIIAKSAWHYFTALALFKAQQLTEAITLLSESSPDNSLYGLHMTELSQLLLQMVPILSEMQQEEMKISHQLTTVDNFYESAKRADNLRRATDHDRKRRIPVRRIGDTHVARMSAQSNYGKALRELRLITDRLRAQERLAERLNRLLTDRYERLCNTCLEHEASIIVDYSINSFVRLDNLITTVLAQAILQEARNDRLTMRNGGISSQSESDELNALEEELQAIKKSLSAIPGQIIEQQKRGAVAVSMAASLVQQSVAAVEQQNLNYDDLRRAESALFYNRSNLATHTLAGYLRYHLHAREVADIFCGRNDPSNTIKRLEHEFNRSEKFGLQQAVFTIAHGKQAEKRPYTGKVGSALAPWIGSDGATVGEVTINLKPYRPGSRSRRGESMTEEVLPDGYWKEWQRLVTRPLPRIPEQLVFEEYGAQEHDVVTTAIETCRWLNNNYSEMTNQAVHILFHFKNELQGAEAAGLSMAVAAYSALRNKPVRPDLALIGSIRSNGAVSEVSGLTERVMAVATLPGIEMVVVPRECESELLLLPLEILCRTVIIGVREIDESLAYATADTGNLEWVARLQRAQVMLLIGEHENAIPLLLEVAANAPEIFTARRLLEISGNWHKATL